MYLMNSINGVLQKKFEDLDVLECLCVSFWFAFQVVWFLFTSKKVVFQKDCLELILVTR